MITVPGMIHRSRPRPAREEYNSGTVDRTCARVRPAPCRWREHDRRVDNGGAPGIGGVPGVNAMVTSVLRTGWDYAV